MLKTCVFFSVINKCCLHRQNISNKYIFVQERNSEVLAQSFKKTHSKPCLTQYLFYAPDVTPDNDFLL